MRALATAVGVLTAHQPNGIRHDPGRSRSDPDRDGDGGAVVEHLGRVTVGEPASGGVGGVEFDERGALGGAVLGKL